MVQGVTKSRTQLSDFHMESRKMPLMNLFSGQQWRYRLREQTYGQYVKDMVGQIERVEGNIYIPIGKRNNGNLQWDAKSPTQCSVTTRRGGVFLILFKLSTLFAELRVGKVEAQRPEEDLRSHRSCRHI